MDTFAKALINLQFIQFTYAKADEILPFICYSPKMDTIVVFRLDKSDENTLNIAKLHKERSKLINTRKITIHVEERVYLAAKWIKNQTNYRLIEIKRGASFGELNQNF